MHGLCYMFKKPSLCNYFRAQTNLRFSNQEVELVGHFQETHLCIGHFFDGEEKLQKSLLETVKF